MGRFPRGTIRVTLLTATFALPCGAKADFYLHYWQNQHDNEHELRLQADGGFYLTKQNYDANGQPTVPAGFDQYSRVEGDLTASYGILPRLSAYARLSWARTELDMATSTSTNMGFADNTAGLSFRAFDFSKPGKPDGITIDAQAQIDYPFYSNVNLTGPALGDASTDFTGGAFVNVPVWTRKSNQILLTGGAGYTYRTNGFSSAIPWSVTAALNPVGEGWIASVTGYGTQSLKTDARTATLLNNTPSSTISPLTGGSFISNAANPSLLVVRGEAGYQITPEIGVTGFVSQSIWGQAAPSGFYAGGGFRYRLGGHRKNVDGTHLTPREYGRSNQGFVNYDVEAHVTRVNDRLNLVKIDKGSQDGIEAGQTFDIFAVKKDGSTGDAVARARVSNVQAAESALTVDEYFKEVWIDEGFLAKRPVQ
jgi:hypothetical protein